MSTIPVHVVDVLESCPHLVTIEMDKKNIYTEKLKEISCIENDAGNENNLENCQSSTIDADKEKSFMMKAKGQMEWYTSSVVAIDHSLMSWRAQVLHNFEIFLQRFDADAERHDIELRRAELLSRVHSIRKVLRDVLRARNQYIEVVKKQREEAIALDIRDWRYIQFCTEIGSKLEWARNEITKNLKPALHEIEKENGWPVRRVQYTILLVRAPEYRGRESPLSFARRELGFIG